MVLRQNLKILVKYLATHLMMIFATAGFILVWVGMRRR